MFTYVKYKRIKSFVILAKVGYENIAFKKVHLTGFFEPKTTGIHVKLPKSKWIKEAKKPLTQRLSTALAVILLNYLIL